MIEHPILKGNVFGISAEDALENLLTGTPLPVGYSWILRTVDKSYGAFVLHPLKCGHRPVSVAYSDGKNRLQALPYLHCIAQQALLLDHDAMEALKMWGPQRLDQWDIREIVQ